MRLAACTAFALFCLVGSCRAEEKPAATSNPGEEQVRATALILRLGDINYRAREAASRELVKMGAAARSALEAGIKNADPEIASRCERLLPLALQSDLLIRIARFEKDKGGKEPVDLPFWPLFRKHVGDDPVSRDSYARLMKFAGVELIDLQKNGDKLGEKYAERLLELNNRQNYNVRRVPNGGNASDPEVDEISVLFLLGCDPRTASDPRLSNLHPNFMYQGPFGTAIAATNGPGVTLRKLFVSWADQRTEPNTISQCLQMMQQHKLPESYAYAMKVYAKKDLPVYIRGQAITAAGRVAKPAQQKDFIEMLKDDTLITQFNIGNNINTAVQMRDVALAMAIHIDGLDIRKYDFPHLKMNPGIDAFQFHYLGFEDDKKRAEVRKQWEAAHANILKARGSWPW